MLILWFDRAERFKEPGTKIIIGYNLHKSKYILIAQTGIPENLQIFRRARINRFGHLKTELSDLFFPRRKVCTGIAVLNLQRELFISGRSTEGLQMAGCSMHASVICRNDQS